MSARRRLAALWVGLVAGGLLAGLAVEGNGFDGSLVRSFQGARAGRLTAAARLVTAFGGPALDVIFAGAVLGLLLAGRRRDAGFVAVAAGGAMILTDAVKWILDRPRPAGGGLVSVSSPSWPSGHASSSIALYGALAVLASRRHRSRRRGGRAFVWAAAAGMLVAVVGASRVYLGVHYPTDVLAGWVVGGLWLLGVARVLEADAAPAG